MSRRVEITMSELELRAFLAEERVVTCATLGPNGRPHLMPLWYIADGATLKSWTYEKSQKVRNLERRPQATLLVEAGDLYRELRGAMLECDVELVREADAKTAIGMALGRRYRKTDMSDLSPEARAGILKQAPKRIGLVFRPTRVVTWDHRKLGGGY